jgi:hypothetical protein
LYRSRRGFESALTRGYGKVIIIDSETHDRQEAEAVRPAISRLRNASPINAVVIAIASLPRIR